MFFVVVVICCQYFGYLFFNVFRSPLLDAQFKTSGAILVSCRFESWAFCYYKHHSSIIEL